jgi:hypothetical protein
MPLASHDLPHAVTDSLQQLFAGGSTYLDDRVGRLSANRSIYGVASKGVGSGADTVPHTRSSVAVKRL